MDFVCIRLDGREPTRGELDAQQERLRRFAYDTQLELFPDPIEEAYKKSIRDRFESADGVPIVFSADEYLGPWLSSAEFLRL